jgi:hypothetical protein
LISGLGFVLVGLLLSRTLRLVLTSLGGSTLKELLLVAIVVFTQHRGLE